VISYFITVTAVHKHYFNPLDAFYNIILPLIGMFLAYTAVQ